MKGAPFFSRVLAFYIDICVVAVVWLFLFVSGLTGYFFGTEEVTLSAALRDSGWFLGTLVAFGLFVSLFYFSYLTANGASTLGKRLMGLKVVRKRNGEFPGFTRSLFRVVCYGISAFPFLVGFFMALVLNGRTMHDILAATVVVREE